MPLPLASRTLYMLSSPYALCEPDGNLSGKKIRENAYVLQFFFLAKISREAPEASRGGCWDY